jgi:uncharacterized repeat protein (TIGR01451 family)
MTANIKVLRGQIGQTAILLDRASLRLGRDPTQNDVALPASDQRISRQHLELVEEFGRWVLIDHSRNGVHVNGELVTYTLTITNYGLITATDVLITDVVPGGANVVEPVPGGTVDLPVVTWAVDELAPAGAAISVQFAVTATQTITNSDYGVSCAEGVSATGSQVVVTQVGWYKVYLPLLLR